MADLLKFANVQSEKKWGQLVMTWATGQSFVPGKTVGQLPKPSQGPTGLQQIKAQCQLLQIVFVPPGLDGFSRINLLEDDTQPGTVNLRLPAKQTLLDAHRALQTSSYSGLPGFYSHFCGSLTINPDTASKRRAFQACRIGDYSLSTCQ